MTATPTPEEPIKESAEASAKPKTSRKKKVIIAVSVILAFIITFVSTFFVIVKLGEARLRESLVSTEDAESDDTDDTAVYHNGKAYHYNTKLINILFLGIDRHLETKETQGQADAIYLFSVDTEKNKVTVISISRNTMCDIDILNSEGEAYGTENKQICLAYSYGNTDKRSSENCAKAVSDLLYSIPINGYYTLHLDSIAKIVDSVGGVSVNIPTDFPEHVFSGKHGKTVTLKGTEALIYLQTRGESNAPRVERHKAFIKSFVSSAKTAVKKDISLPFDITKQLSKEATTNINMTSAVYLGTQALNWTLEFANVSGSYGFDGKYETMTVDEEALRELVINNFYIQSN